MEPLLTICVPAYNVEAYLEHGLSTYDQDRFAGRLEVLVVDDGSKDSTAKIARSFVERRPQVFRLISKENGGHGSVINRGIQEASGRYFRVVDGDDWVDPDALDEFLDVLASTSADILIDERVDVIFGTGLTHERPLPQDLPFGRDVPYSHVAQRVVADALISIHTLCAKTSYLRAQGVEVLEKTFHEDAEFCVKTISGANTIRFVPTFVYQYLIGNASQSMAADNMVRRYKDHERVVLSIAAYADSLRTASLLKTSSGLDDPEAWRAQAAEKSAQLIVNSHYNLLLIFDTQRDRGRARAKAFRAQLAKDYPWLKASTDKRYWMALAAGALGVDALKLDQLQGRTSVQANQES